MIKRSPRLSRLLLCAAVGATLLSPFAARAQAPAPAPIGQIISYQGLLTGAGGLAVPDGAQSLSFRIFENGAVVFTQNSPVVSSGGVFNAFLSVGALSFDPAKTYELGITFAGSETRHPIAAVPVALNAKAATNAASAVAFTGALVGDVTGTQGATTVEKIQGTPVAATAPTAGQVLRFNADSGKFEPSSTTGGTVTDVTASGPLASSGGATPNITLNGVVPVANGGTGSDTKNFVDLTTDQSIGGAKTFTAPIVGSLQGNADTATNAGSFTGPLAGDVTGTQGATIVERLRGTGIATAAPTTGQVLVFDGTNYTPTTPPAITVQSDEATLTGDGSTDNKLRVKAAGVGQAQVANGYVDLTEAQTVGGAKTFTAPIGGDITGNAATATNATTAGSAGNFTGNLVGDVTGRQGATVVAQVGGQTAADVASGAVAANAATSANTANTIVKRDANGNFAAGTIAANLTGNASGSAGSFTGDLEGDVTGKQGATKVEAIQGQPVAPTAPEAGQVLVFTPGAAGVPDRYVPTTPAASTVKSDGTTIVGNGSDGDKLRVPDGGIKQAQVAGGYVDVDNPQTVVGAKTFSAPVTSTQFNIGANRVLGTPGTNSVAVGVNAGAVNAGGSNAFVGTNAGSLNDTGQDNVFLGADAGLSNTTGFNNAFVGAGAGADNTEGSNNIALGNGAGDLFTTGTGNIAIGNRGEDESRTTRIGTRGTQNRAFIAGIRDTPLTGLPVVITADGQLGAGSGTAPVTAVTALGPLASSGGTTPQISLSGIVPVANGGTGNTTGAVAGDVTGTLAATVVSQVGGQTAANVASGAVAANAATSANTANTIVKRDANGDFAARIITGNLAGNATSATTATNSTDFSGTLTGDVTGTQKVTVVERLRGTTLSTTPPTAAGQVLTYDGAQYAPAAPAASTVQSDGTTITGNGTAGSKLGVPNNGITQAQVAGGYVDLTTAQTVGGAKTFTDPLSATSSTGTALTATTSGIGNALIATTTSTSGIGSALVATTSGFGSALIASTTGTGQAGSFTINNASNSNFALSGTTNGTGAALSAISTNANLNAISATGKISATSDINTATQYNIGTDAVTGAGVPVLRLVGPANTTGRGNIFVGPNAGSANTEGNFNAFIGRNAGQANTTGTQNAFVGTSAGFNNISGANNAFIGQNAGIVNTTGTSNTFIGQGAGYNSNTGAGNTTGDNNIALGTGAGRNLTTGNDNILIGNAGAAESATTRIGTSQTRAFIAGISGVTPAVANPLPVVIDSNGQLGTGSAAAAGVTSVSATGPLTVTNPTTTPNIALTHRAIANGGTGSSTRTSSI
jgi:hypothetical protein